MQLILQKNPGIRLQFDHAALFKVFIMRLIREKVGVIGIAIYHQLNSFFNFPLKNGYICVQNHDRVQNI